MNGILKVHQSRSIKTNTMFSLICRSNFNFLVVLGEDEVPLEAKKLRKDKQCLNGIGIVGHGYN